jgi:YD repeat-containing protein
LKEKYGIEAKGSMSGWLYEWDLSGMLTKVINPQQGKVRFGYDALGRRTCKEVRNKRTCWLWDGNVPLHEWTELQEEPQIDM